MGVGKEGKDMERKREQFIWKIIFFSSLLLGVVVTNVLFQEQAGTTNLWSFDPYSISYNQLPKDEYFIFLLFHRGKQLMGILLLLFLTNVQIGIGIPVFLFLFSMSCFLSLETMRLGIVGVFFSIIYLFPHYFLYGGTLYNFWKMKHTTQNNYQKLVLFSMGIGIWIFGCYIEAFWNVDLVSNIMKRWFS